VKSERGFTLLEMIVATTIMGIAIAGLMAGLASSTRNVIRLRDYGRAVQLARLKMNSLIADSRGAGGSGTFEPAITGGLECGWQAAIGVAEKNTPAPMPGDYVVDRIQLEIWWTSGAERRTFPMEGYRMRLVQPGDPGGTQ